MHICNQIDLTCRHHPDVVFFDRVFDLKILDNIRLTILILILNNKYLKIFRMSFFRLGNSMKFIFVGLTQAKLYELGNIVKILYLKKYKIMKNELVKMLF